MFIVLIADRFDSYQRYWVRRDTLAEAQKVAWEYEKDNSHTVEIYKADQLF
jgi:hypothetical protein